MSEELAEIEAAQTVVGLDLIRRGWSVHSGSPAQRAEGERSQAPGPSEGRNISTASGESFGQTRLPCGQDRAQPRNGGRRSRLSWPRQG